MDEQMAIGTLFASLSLAVFSSSFLAVVNGLSTPQGLLLYAAAGFLGLMVCLVVNGVFDQDGSRIV